LKGTSCSFGEAAGRGLAIGALAALVAVGLSWPGGDGVARTASPWVREHLLAWILAQFSPLMISIPVYGAVALGGAGVLWLACRGGYLRPVTAFLTHAWFTAIGVVIVVLAYGLAPVGVVIGAATAALFIAFAASLRLRSTGTILRSCPPAVAWGFAMPLLAGVVSAAIAARWMLFPVAAEPPDARVSDRFAYGILAQGDPVALFWTDKADLWTAVDVHGGPFAPRHVAEAVSERLWPGRDGFFGMGDQRFLHVAPDLRVTGRDVPEWMRPIAGLAEDPATGNVIALSEWGAHWAVLSSGGGVLASGQIDWKHGWPFPWATVDTAGRRAFLTEALHTGTLSVLDLDTNRIVRQAPHRYLYETVFDAATSTLWGTRPTLGQVAAIDVDTLEIVRTVELGPAPRPLRFSPARRALYSCSFKTGAVWEIDADTGATTRLGRCGRRCRGLALDEAHDTLWVASRDGICRMPVRDRRREPWPS
jgi:hypothetical protein